MADVDALLADVEDEDYDLRDDEEEALLQEDEGTEEAADVLDLNMDDNLNEDEFIYTPEEEGSIRDKFTSERVEAEILPDTTSQLPSKVPFKQPQQTSQQYSNNNRGRFPRRNQRGGHFRGNMRGRGNQRGYQNAPNKNFIQKPRPESNKYFINPHFKGFKIQNPGWQKKPVMAILPWANQAPQHAPTSNYQVPNRMPPPVHQVHNNPPFQPIQQVLPQIKQSVHQRLGYTNPPPLAPQMMNAFVHPPPPQLPPVIHNQPPKFEEERIVTMNSFKFNQQPPIYEPPLMQQQPFQQPQTNFNMPMQYHNCPMQFNPPPPQNNYLPQQYPISPQWQSPQQSHWQTPPTEPQLSQNMMYEPPDFNENNYNMNQSFQVQNSTPFTHHPQQYQPPQLNFNPRPKPNFNQNNSTFNNTHINHIKNKKFVVKLSPNKRPRGRNQEGEDGFKRRIFENTNLQEVVTVDTTAPQFIESQQHVVEEDEETRKYREKIEAQKRQREAFLQMKEERRKMSAQRKLEDETNAKKPIAPVIINAAPFNEDIQSFQENKVEKDQLKSFLTNRKIIAKDQSLVDTSVVVVSNLAAGTSEVKLRKLCQGVGEIKNFELSSKERQATVQFNSVASAHAFYKRYQRFMLDLSMIQVTLKQ